MHIARAAIMFMLLAFAGGTQAEPLPLDALFKGLRAQSASISPDGHYLGLILRGEGKTFVAVKDRSSTKPIVPVLISAPNDPHRPQWCAWVNPTRLLCGFYGNVKTKGVHEIYVPETRLAAVNADGSEQKILVDNPWSINQQYQDRIIDWAPGDSKSVLIELNDHGGRAVFSLDTYSGQKRRVMPSHYDIGAFGTDGHGTVRLGWGIVDTTAFYFARLEGETYWRQLARVNALASDDVFTPVSPIPGTNFVYAMRNHDGHQALWKVDLQDKQDPELIFGRPDVDVVPWFYMDRRLLGVLYETDAPGGYFVDPDAELLNGVLGRLFSERRFRIVDMTSDLKVAVVEVDSDKSAPTFYLLDIRNTPPTLVTIGSRYPALAGFQLAVTKRITYAARDGTTIHGYLTSPTAASQSDAPPLIVMPHGGPAARDIWGFNPMVQYLASRGYAVLQMNYRGSAGYGTQFRTAGRDWSGLPYSDMIDGQKWAIAQKFGDPARMCVVGASFGGFLALSAAVRDSAVFRCAVSIAGVSDLGKLEDERSWFAGARLMHELLRNTNFKESPRRHAEEVRIPVLLIQGDEDSTVNPEQATLMDAALAHAGKPHRLVIVQGADHHFSEDAYFEKMLSEIGAFLHENLDAGTAATTSTTSDPAAAQSSASH